MFNNPADQKVDISKLTKSYNKSNNLIRTDRTIDFAEYYDSIYINRKLRYFKHNDDTWQDMETNDTYSGTTINNHVVDAIHNRYTIEFDRHKMPNI